MLKRMDNQSINAENKDRLRGINFPIPRRGSASSTGREVDRRPGDGVSQPVPHFRPGTIRCVEGSGHRRPSSLRLMTTTNEIKNVQ